MCLSLRGHVLLGGAFEESGRARDAVQRGEVVGAAWVGGDELSEIFQRAAEGVDDAVRLGRFEGHPRRLPAAVGRPQSGEA